jgi:hypothetical protein
MRFAERPMDWHVARNSAQPGLKLTPLGGHPRVPHVCNALVAAQCALQYMKSYQESMLLTQAGAHTQTGWVTSEYSPATTGGPPPCILSALTVATRTTQSGLRPEARHLMLKNFSIPMSAPNPAWERKRAKPPMFVLQKWLAATIEHAAQHDCQHMQFIEQGSSKSKTHSTDAHSSMPCLKVLHLVNWPIHRQSA